MRRTLKTFDTKPVNYILRKRTSNRKNFALYFCIKNYFTHPKNIRYDEETLWLSRWFEQRRAIIKTIDLILSETILY